MTVKFNSEILNNIINEKVNTEDALLLINEIIDKELEKDEPDFEYIEECTDALLELQNENSDNIEIKPFVYLKRKNVGKLKLTKTAVRIILIAAILLATTITASAAVKNVTGKGIIENIVSPETETTVAEETTTAPETITVRRKKSIRKKRRKKRVTTTKAAIGFNADIESETEAQEENEDTDEKTGEADSPQTESDDVEITEDNGERVVTREASADISYPSDEGE